MAFLIGDQTDKQYLNLSVLAFDTIQSDMFSFGCHGVSTFINRVFSNFYADANASISIVLSRKREEWLKILSFLPNNKAAVEGLLVAERKRLQDEALGYPKGCGIKVRLNNANYDYLTNPIGTCNEEIHYRRGKQACSGLYIKAVLEEYARKSFVEREAIFFHEQLECISDAIERQKQLKITIQSGAQFYVRPYCITTDRQSAYHYLVGLSCPVNQDESQQAPYSFRVSRIKEITLCKSRSGFLSAQKKAMLSEIIAEKGAPFVGSNKETIRVYLTDEGKQMYKNILHMRPTYISCDADNNNIYNFECSSFQIKRYFIQFGEHAQILSPTSLAEEFQSFYQAALNRLLGQA